MWELSHLPMDPFDSGGPPGTIPVRVSGKSRLWMMARWRILDEDSRVYARQIQNAAGHRHQTRILSRPCTWET